LVKKININFLRSHLSNPELAIEIKCVQDVINIQPQLSLPSFVIVRKLLKFWKITEKIFCERALICPDDQWLKLAALARILLP